MARALAYLGVQHGEERSVVLMIAHAFFMGCATVFFETAASAFFLARFEARVIPWVYLAAAVVNLATGAVYGWVQSRVSFAQLMKGTLWLLLVAVVLMRVGFAVTSAPWLVFGGLVGYRVLSSLTDLEYWAVAGRIYDLRQAKRLFGLIGTGEVVARTLGAFAVPLIVRGAGVSNLLVLSAAGLGACLVMVGLVLGRVADSDTAPTPATTDVRSGLRRIVANPYLALVVGVAVAATFGKYFVDFAFLEQLSVRSRVDVELASYLGVFAGVTQTLSLLTRLFASRPLLARFGIRVGVMVLPVLQLICTVGLVASGGLGREGMVFWLVLGNQGLYKTLKHPVDNASFKVLYQPLEPAQRLAAQIAVEVVLAPVVVGLAGAVMLLFSAVMTYDPVRFGLALLLTFGLWTWLAWRAGRGYLRALIEALRRYSGEDIAKALPALARERREPVPPGVIAWLHQQVAVADPDGRSEALAVLDHLGHVAQDRERQELRGLLHDEAREVAWTLGAWRDLGQAPDLARLRDALVAEVQQARSRAFSAAACGHDGAAIHEARARIDHASKECRSYAHEVLDLVLAPRERGYLLPLLESVSPAEHLARLERCFPQAAASVEERLRQLHERSGRWMRPATRDLVRSVMEQRGLDTSLTRSERPTGGVARGHASPRGLSSENPILVGSTTEGVAQRS